MRKILISIRPEWVKKILNGEKTAEVRLSVPKCNLPCEVYIYCTKGGEELLVPFETKEERYNSQEEAEGTLIPLNGKVVAKFTMYDHGLIHMDTGYCESNIKPYCRKITERLTGGLSFEQVNNYSKGKPVYLWRIENLKIFVKPKELSDFYREGTMNQEDYLNSIDYDDQYPSYPDGADMFQVDEEIAEYDSTGWEIYKDYLNKQEIKYAPQSWRYIKVIKSWCYTEEFK